MERFELYLVTSLRDVDEAMSIGLLDEDIEFYCEACEEEVGLNREEEFAPFAIVLSPDEMMWLVCFECHLGVTDPLD